MKRNITKQLLHVYGSVWDSHSITASTARGNSETRAFDAISILSVQTSRLFHVIVQVLFDRAVTLLFCYSIVQRYKGNVGCWLFQNSRITDLQWQRLMFYRLQCWVSAVQRGLSWQPSRPPRCTPVYILANFHTFSRFWKPVSQFKTFSILSIPRGNPACTRLQIDAEHMRSPESILLCAPQ